MSVNILRKGHRLVECVFLDYQRPSDTVTHRGLMKKLDFQASVREGTAQMDYTLPK